MIDRSLLASTSTSNANASLQVPASRSQSQTPGSGHRIETEKGTKKGKGRIVDMPLPEEETPRIKRNKQLRSGAMAAIVNGRGREPEGKTMSTPTRTGHRRKSSVSRRGKRVSSSFDDMGIISELFNTIVRFWESF